jgi:hypothetical protein
MKKQFHKIRLHKETLRHLGEGGLGRAAGGVESNDPLQKVCASQGSDCGWTCPYSECHPTWCFCYTGVATDCC